MWSVAKAREQSWTNAEVLDVIGNRPKRHRWLNVQGRLVGAYGRGMLLPLAKYLT